MCECECVRVLAWESHFIQDGVVQLRDQGIQGSDFNQTDAPPSLNNQSDSDFILTDALPSPNNEILISSRQMHRQVRDEVHWDNTGLRRVVNMLLTHISEAWGVPLPERYKSLYGRDIQDRYGIKYVPGKKSQIQLLNFTKDQS